MEKLILAFFALLLSFSMQSQTLINSEFLGSQTQAEVDMQLSASGFSLSAENGIEYYKIWYTTPDPKGVLDTASGLLVLPDNGLAEYPMVTYQHGTTNGPQDCPSNLQAGSDLSAFFASQGFVVSACDYLGMGEARGFHPYVHAATQASAAIDMLYAITDYCDQNAIGLNGDLFVSGYSQGGHAAMATHRELQLNHKATLPVKASAPMSGPYSISGVMKDQILGDEQYFTAAYIPYVVLGYQEVYGNLYNELSDIFKPQYIDDIQSFYDGEIGLGDLNAALLQTIFAQIFAFRPKQMFLDHVIDSMLMNPNYVLNQALANSDTWNGWVDEAPTRLYYCTGDEQVPPLNSQFAETEMNNLGATDLVAFDKISEATGAGTNNVHGPCAIPASTSAAIFFKSFLSTGIEAPSFERMEVYPNPVKYQLNIETPDIIHDEVSITLSNVNGQVVYQQQLDHLFKTMINVEGLSAGMYILDITTTSESYSQKVMIR